MGRERFHSMISYMGHREDEDEPEETLRGLILFEDDAEGSNARILVMDPIRTNWPKDASRLTIGSDSFFAGDR